MLKLLDLFAGMGALSHGFDGIGEVVFANDVDKFCKVTYDANSKVPLTLGDIRKIDPNTLPDFDVLLAGFPCQPFSISGYKKGFEDTRGDLFFTIVDILSAKQPRAFLLENVKNLVSHDKGKTFKIIISSLEELGYNVFWKVLNSAQYGNVPQGRERVYIIGLKNGSYVFPSPVERTVQITDILDDEVDPYYYYTKGVVYERIKPLVVRRDTTYLNRCSQLDENKKGVCFTLTAGMGMGGNAVPIVLDAKGRIRKLTPRECARVQGFSESFILPDTLSRTQLYKQLGNSVTTSVIKRLAENLKEALDG